ncbi:hypothetical protein B1C78_00120 [Thioalkalivibrio denitrificans]|uniref:Type III pantothenate kinase n=1 Tax=Thioalkalivibrio denitrificans TaxID=108003 RepID=A0A1V3NUH7_9GAMM|nr:type III pantothenate kinase [Thioalkalivibrio denitrificans]OOG28789.1 hypothetical protein B1C78_00120 [Thioalkalivibrio denitrificans]
MNGKLLLDAGNSRLKWAFVGAGHEPVTGCVQPDARGFGELVRQVANAGTPDAVALVSVRGEQFADQVSGWCAEAGWPEPLRVRASSGTHGVRPAYANLDSLGADRYAAMVAARRLFSGPVVVVDCGTAVTVDGVDEAGAHAGGVIMPGRDLMLDALSTGTAVLPRAEDREVDFPAVNTVDAIVSGSTLGLVYAVEGICRRMVECLGGQAECVLTGGNAGLVRAHGTLSYAWRPWLVLQGAYFIMEGESCDPWHSC